MKMKLKSRRLRTIEEIWAIEDEHPAVCGPSPISFATRYGLTLSKRYLEHLRRRQTNGNGRPTVSRTRKPAHA
jgi:hypothetical protein